MLDARSTTPTLRQFTDFLQHHHLQALTEACLRLAREYGAPLLQRLADLPEAELSALAERVQAQFCASMGSGQALEAVAETLRLWETDQLPGVPLAALQPEDLVLLAAAQKQAMMTFLPLFTRESTEMLAVIAELEHHLMRAQGEAFQVFTRVRTEALEREARAEAERRQELECLHQAQIEQLREADRYKDEFISVISHELRTPLNFIMGFASLMEDEVPGPLTAHQRQHVQKILHGADRMLLLVDDLLDFARIQAGSFSLSPEQVTFGALVEDAVGAVRPLAEQKDLVMVTEVEAGMVLALDAQRITQVLTNLLSNALKFTDRSGRVTVRAYREGARVVAEVADTGIGIQEVDIPRLFQRFQQLDMSPTRRAGGTGLGLSIAKALVEAHGGAIGVRSVPGTGSTFYFTLPLPASEA